MAIYSLFAWLASLFVSKASTLLFSCLEIKLCCFIYGQIHASNLVLKVGGCFGMACAITG